MFLSHTLPPKSFRRTLFTKGLCTFALACGVFPVMSGNLLAGLVAGDDFTYPEGLLASGKNNGGVGWAEPWTGARRTWVLPSRNLTHSSTGYDGTQTGTGLVNSTMDRSGVTSRSLRTPIAGTATGTDVWFSVLIQVDENEIQSGRIGLHFNVAESGPAASRLGSAAGFIVAKNDFRTYVNGGPNTGSPSEKLETNATHLIVGRISLRNSESSNVHIWLNPANVTAESALGNASVVFPADFKGPITNVGVETYSGARNGGAGMVDALRIGTDLASVVNPLSK